MISKIKPLKFTDEEKKEIRRAMFGHQHTLSSNHFRRDGN